MQAESKIETIGLKEDLKTSNKHLAQVSPHMHVHFLSSSDLLTTHSFLIFFYLHSYLQHEKKEAAFDEVLLGKDMLCSQIMEEAASSFNRLKISQR